MSESKTKKKLHKCKKIIKIMFEFWKRAIKIIRPSLLSGLEACMMSLNNKEDKFDFKVLDSFLLSLKEEKQKKDQDMLIEDLRSHILRLQTPSPLQS